MRAVYRYWATIVFAAVVVQVGFAGYGAFNAASKVEDATIDEDLFSDGFGLHTGLGYLIVLAGLVLVLIALGARLGRRGVLHAAGLLGLLVLQVPLARFAYEVPAIGFLHPVNALLIVGLAGSLAAKAWRNERSPAQPATVVS